MRMWATQRHAIFSSRSSLLFALVLFAARESAAQTTINVPADIQTIQAAIDLAHPGDTILVQPGIYNESIDFKGKAIRLTSTAQSLAEAQQTTISSTGDGPVVTFASGETSGTQLNGFTISGGHASFASRKNG